MKSQFSKTIVVSLLALGLVGVAVADNVTSTTTTVKSQTPPSNKKMQVLFTQTADSATLTPQQQKGWYKLTLNKINPDVLWFSDRPNRISGGVDLAQFIKLWNKPNDNKSFGRDNPNADLVGITQNNARVRGVFMLTKPVYDLQQQTLSYQVYQIANGGNFNGGVTSLQNVALFIDSSCNPWAPWSC